LGSLADDCSRLRDGSRLASSKLSPPDSWPTTLQTRTEAPRRAKRTRQGQQTERGTEQCEVLTLRHFNAARKYAHAAQLCFQPADAWNWHMPLHVCPLTVA
jgi:hypothetical protein